MSESQSVHFFFVALVIFQILNHQKSPRQGTTLGVSCKEPGGLQLRRDEVTTRSQAEEKKARAKPNCLVHAGPGPSGATVASQHIWILCGSFRKSVHLCDFWLGSWPDHSKHRHIRHVSFTCCALLHFRYGKSRFGRSAFEPQRTKSGCILHLQCLSWLAALWNKKGNKLQAFSERFGSGL